MDKIYVEASTLLKFGIQLSFIFSFPCSNVWKKLHTMEWVNFQDRQYT